MSEGAQHDEENNEGGDPAPVLVGVDNLISSKGDEEGDEGDDEDPGISRDRAVDCVKELSTNDSVCGRPADAGQNIEKRDCGSPSGQP